MIFIIRNYENLITIADEKQTKIYDSCDDFDAQMIKNDFEVISVWGVNGFWMKNYSQNTRGLIGHFTKMEIIFYRSKIGKVIMTKKIFLDIPRPI